MNLIGMMGHAGSGKNTVADFLVDLHQRRQHSAIQMALADPMKEICKEVFDFSDEQLYGPSEKRNEPDKRYVREKRGSRGGTIDHFDVEGKAVVVDSPLQDVYLTPRYALQRLGTEWGRDCYRDIWVDLTLRRAAKIRLDAPQTLMVITDVRFRNEVEAIRTAGGEVWKIHRRNVLEDAHVSEREQDGIEDYDRFIDNYGTLGELRRLVGASYTAWLSKSL